MAQEIGHSGGMSVREAGRRGGERVKAKYGSEFYEEIGRKGGEASCVPHLLILHPDARRVFFIMFLSCSRG